MNEPDSTPTLPAALQHWQIPLLVGAVLLFCSGMFFTPGGFVSGDEHRQHDLLIAATFDAMFRDAVLNHGQFPLRSHLVGGGYPVIAHPSDASLSPMILPSLILGERIGLRVNLILALLLGTLGIFLLARDILRLPGTAPLFAALAYALAGWHPSRVLVGYYESAFFLLFPMMLYGVLTARESYRRLVLTAVLSAVCLMQVLSGAFVFLLYALAHALWGVRQGGETRPRGKLVVWLGLVLGLAALLGAVKFLPTADLLQRGELGARSGAPYDGSMDYYYNGDLDDFSECLIEPVPLQAVKRSPGAGPGKLLTPEYPYVGAGWLVFALALLCLFANRRPARRTIFVFFLFTWICFGSNAPLLPNLHALLAWLPISRPVQYFNYVIYAELILLSAYGYAWIEKRLADKRHIWLLLPAAVLLLLPSALPNAQRYREAFRHPLPEVAREEFYQVRLADPRLREESAVGYGNAYLNVLRGVGTITWDSGIMLPERVRPRYLVDERGRRHAVPGHRGEAWLVRPGNEVLDLTISPNTIEATVRVIAPETLVINQNHDPDWQAEGGTLVNHEGLLGVRLERGATRVRLSYRPWPVFAGLGITVAALLLLILGRRMYRPLCDWLR